MACTVGGSADEDALRSPLEMEADASTASSCSADAGASRDTEVAILIKQSKIDLSQIALKLCKRDLRVLVGLLAGRVSLGRHLAVVGIRSGALYPLCGEDEDTFFYFLDQCNATMMLRRNFLEAALLSPYELSAVHWSTLFKDF